MATKKHTMPVWAGTLGIVVGLGVGGGVGYVAHNQPQTVQVSQSAKDVTAALPKGFSKVLSTYTTIESNYYKNVSTKKLADGAINGMVKALDDPFSNYLQNNDATSLNTTISGSFGGIGATMVETADGVYVDSFTKNGAAQKAGLKVNDQIVSVDGKSVAKKGVNAIVEKIRGKIGTKVTVGILRDGKTKTFTMTRAKVSVPSITGTIDKTNKKIGIITFSTFTETSGKEMKAIVKQLRKQGATKFIMDLRGNPGGVLQEALKIDSMFLKDGQTILQVKSKGQAAEVYKASAKYDGGFKVTEPTVVLIDGNSASASEITAAALSESGGDKLIGTKSYGKGTVQTIGDMGSGSELKLTIAKWLTPTGEWIHEKGIKPDIVADFPAYSYTSEISAETLKADTVSTDVKSLQTMLKALDYDPGTVNGYYGTTTVSAVKKFQTANKLTVSGTADSATIAKLESQLTTKVSQNDNVMKKAEAELAK